MGHRNGVVGWWTPNMSEAVVRVRCHLGPVSSIGVWSEDGLGGATVATAGVEGGSYFFALGRVDLRFDRYCESLGCEKVERTSTTVFSS